MLRSNSKSLGNRVVSPEEEKLQWEGFANHRLIAYFISIRRRLCQMLSQSVDARRSCCEKKNQRRFLDTVYIGLWCDVMIDRDCLRYDFHSKFKSLCRL